MSRNNKFQLPLLTNSLSGSELKSKRHSKTHNKEIKNIHIGITNFNSKQHQMRLKKVKENKLRTKNPSKFGKFKLIKSIRLLIRI